MKTTQESELTSAGWALQRGLFGKACCGTEWLQLWMIIPCAALCCMVLLASAALHSKVIQPVTLGMGGYILCPVWSRLCIKFLSEKQIWSKYICKIKSNRLLLFFVPPRCCLPRVLHNCFSPHMHGKNVFKGYTCTYTYLIMGNLITL